MVSRPAVAWRVVCRLANHRPFRRERDTTEQLIGDIDAVVAVVTDLVNGAIDWPTACTRLPRYTGTQNVD